MFEASPGFAFCTPAFCRAYASSAPIAYYSGEVPCDKFARAITDSYKSQSQNCAASIRRSWAIMDKMTDTGEFLRTLSAYLAHAM